MKIIEAILAIIFIAALSLPLFSTVFIFEKSNQKEESIEIENFSLKEVIRSYGRFKYNFEENYTPRRTLITLNGLLKRNLLKVSPSEKVLLGENGWLFLAAEDALDNHRNIYPFTKPEKELWLSTLQRRQKFCDINNSSYFFVISPDKPNIYPEYMPPNYSIVNNESRFDSLSNFFPDINIINVHKQILNNKYIAPLYYKTDTHWNELGAYFAYNEIIMTLHEEYPQIIIPISRISFSTRETYGGDLSRLIGLKYESEEILYTPDINRTATNIDGSTLSFEFIDVQSTGTVKTICDSGEIDKAVIFHDSFGVALIPLLAEHFKEAIFIWSNDFQPDVVLENSPNIVIQQLAERRLLNWTPNPNEIQTFNE